MAIKNFKSILDKTGYYVSEKDRKIFERGSLPAYFGRGATDTIEFILYDQADNILPQGKDGKTVRYVDITDRESIRKYILIVRPQSSNMPNEYFVDVEKLINEAGYKNGIFKTQVTLLNKRVGTEKKQNKLWVHEISPSRTEIRVLPMKVSNPKLRNNLLTRYDIFLRDGEFRDDIVNRIQSFQQTLSAETVKKILLNAYGQDWINLVKSEFQVPDIDDFLRRVVEKSKEAINYFIDGKEWKINNVKYGKPQRNAKADASLDIMKLYKVSQTIVCDVIESLLPKRNILEKTTASPILQASRDKVQQILQSFTSNKSLDTKASSVARIIKPRPIKKGNVSVKPPKPRPKPPIKIPPPPPKKYYFYMCTGTGKVGKAGFASKSSFGIRGGGCFQSLSAFFSYEDMSGNRIKFNLKPGSKSKICALEGSVKVSGGGQFIKQELCEVRNYKPIIIPPKPVRIPPPPPPPPPIDIKPFPLPDFKLPPIPKPRPRPGWPPIIDDFPPIKFPPLVIKPKPTPRPIPPPRRGIDLSRANPPTILTAPDIDQGEPDSMFNEGTGRFESMSGGGGGGGMGTFGGYRKSGFGSGFNPFGSSYGF